ncbi:MAG: glucosaminidase domain-containing protein [Bacilli bacterium]|nr:glucosaminidase domain-containing protein [Bacilli bacterium]
MGIYRSGTITYDPDKMSEAVLNAKKVNTNASELKSGMDGIVNSVPSGFSSSGINTAQSLINGINTKLTDLSGTLEDIQKQFDDYIANEKIINALINSKYAELITLENGQQGFLYVPKGYSSTAGLPLLVWLAGAGELGNANKMKTTGLPYLIENGCAFDSVVWVPISSHPWSWDTATPNPGNKYYDKMLNLAGGDSNKVYNTMVSCEELVDKLKLDRDRINLYGYSNGAYGVDRYAYTYPDYFATVTSFGGARTDNIPKDSSTTFIFINGTYDQGSNEALNAYNVMVANGVQAMIYQVVDATHSDDTEMINSALIHDILNIKRGQKLNTLVSGVQKVDRSTVVSTSMMENGNKEVKNSWYVQLVPGTATAMTLEATVDDTAIDNSSNNSTVISKGPYTTDLSVYHNKPGFKVTKGNLTYEYLTEEQVREITAVVCAEMAGNHLWTYDDGLAIASTILNRCENGNWIKSHGTNPVDQIRAPGQFSVYGGRSFLRYYNRTDLTQAEQEKLSVAIKATRDAIYGGIRNQLDYTEFRAPTITSWQGYQVSDYGNVYNRSTYDNRVTGGNPVAVNLSNSVTLESNSAIQSTETPVQLSSNSGTAQATTLNANVGSLSSPSTNNVEPTNSSQESIPQKETTPTEKPLEEKVEEVKDVNQKGEDTVKEPEKKTESPQEEKAEIEEKTPSASSEQTTVQEVQTYVINDLRNKSVYARANLTAEDINMIIDSEVRGKKSILVGSGEYWVKAAEETGLDPLFLLALARQESGLGTSNLALTRNNFFGMKYQNGVQYFGKVTRDYAGSVEEGIMKAARWIKEFYVGQYNGDTTQKFGYTGYNGGNNYGDILTSIMGRMKDAYEGKTGKEMTFIM